MPLLIMILFAFYSKKATAQGAKATMIFHVIFYALSKILIKDVHYLYVLGVLFFLDLLVMWIVSKITNKGEEFIIEDYSIASEVGTVQWVHVKKVAITISIVVVLVYLLFSPLGIAK